MRAYAHAEPPRPEEAERLLARMDALGEQGAGADVSTVGARCEPWLLYRLAD